ncbi:MAG: hypothetical protein PVI86_00355 [Phycisphaerae bacterium]|jgi:hypothetical protein
MRLSGDINFLDADGFIIVSDYTTQTLLPESEEDLRGTVVTTPSAAKQIETIDASLKYVPAAP